MSIAKRSKLPIFEIALLLIFAVVIFFIEHRRRIKRTELLLNRGTVMGLTVQCRKNYRSSMHDLYYHFEYKERRYSGSVKFDKSKRGDICFNVPVLIEFDSTAPLNNHAILGSVKSRNIPLKYRFRGGFCTFSFMTTMACFKLKH